MNSDSKMRGKINNFPSIFHAPINFKLTYTGTEQNNFK